MLFLFRAQRDSIAISTAITDVHRIDVGIKVLKNSSPIREYEISINAYYKDGCGSGQFYYIKSTTDPIPLQNNIINDISVEMVESKIVDILSIVERYDGEKNSESENG